MRTKNIISAFQSILAIEKNNVDKIKINRMLDLSIHEAKTLRQFCKMLIDHSLKSFEAFDGYFISYSIKQISKEFDLLRFSDDLVINIELKSELQLNEIEKINKIRTQMEQNYYYLLSLCKKVIIYTYVENDGLYKYDATHKQANKINWEDLIDVLSSQSVNFNINPDNLFVPSNYLISPFNNPKRFMNDEYFLNDMQQKTKKEIVKSIDEGNNNFYCISANAGTGKTLLMYDLVKTVIKSNINPIIIHCGKLNQGHSVLITKYNWKILSISSILHSVNDNLIPDDINIIFIDESQRIRDFQLKLIIEKALALNIPIVFSYDKKQFLKSGETKDIYEYINHDYPQIVAIEKTLSNKIRTNKEIASFITNLFEIGKSNSNLSYKDITISYFDGYNNAKNYIAYLCKNRGWTSITFTDSMYENESVSQIAEICESNAHNVIGQEFDKVVFVMDKNFRYGANGKLQANKTYYSIEGMLYQIVTRVVNELKIIVLDNIELYVKLLEIKALDENNIN